MSMAWIIIKSLDLFKVLPIIVNFMKSNMLNWKTTLFLSHNSGNRKSNPLSIKRSIFQGHFLYSLLFCLALIPLTTEVNRTDYGYKIDKKSINHLFYMDDLKLFTNDDHELEGLQGTVKNFSDDIDMKFGLEKCAKTPFLKGRHEKSTSMNYITARK